MFNINVNGTCKHFVENTGMHETAGRLYAAISELTKQKLSELGEVASFVGVTPQVLKNWESRGVSKQGRLDLHGKLGINPNWLATGKGEMLPNRGGLSSVGNMTATPAAAKAVTLGQTLENLGEELAKATPQTRAAVADLLSRYAQDPATGQSLAQAIELLVQSDINKKTAS